MNPRLPVAKLARRLKQTWIKLNASRELSFWKQNQGEVCKGDEARIVDVAELGLSKDSLVAVRERLTLGRPIVIAQIDQDGFFLSNFGPIDALPCVEATCFQKRSKFPVDLIAVGGAVGVRKTYNHGNPLFLNELRALKALNLAGCNVPPILDVNCEEYSLTTAWIPGVVLREALAAKGAILRDRDIRMHAEFQSVAEDERKQMRIEQGRRHLKFAVSAEFIERAFEEMRKIHTAGFRINDIKYGNIIIERDSGDPYFVDFEGSDDLRGLGHRLASALYDSDIQLFNQHFGTNKPTTYA